MAMKHRGIRDGSRLLGRSRTLLRVSLRSPDLLCFFLPTFLNLAEIFLSARHRTDSNTSFAKNQKLPDQILKRNGPVQPLNGYFQHLSDMPRIIGKVSNVSHNGQGAQAGNDRNAVQYGTFQGNYYPRDTL